MLERTSHRGPLLESYFMQHYAMRIAQAAATLWEARNELRWDPDTADLFQGDAWVVLDTRDKVAAAIEDVRGYLAAIDAHAGPPLQYGGTTAHSIGLLLQTAVSGTIAASGVIRLSAGGEPGSDTDPHRLARRRQAFSNAAMRFRSPVWDLLLRARKYGDRWHAPSGSYWPEIPGISFEPLAAKLAERLDATYRFSLPAGPFKNTLHLNLMALPAHHLVNCAYREFGGDDLAPLLQASLQVFPLAIDAEGSLHVLTD